VQRIKKVREGWDAVATGTKRGRVVVSDAYSREDTGVEGDGGGEVELGQTLSDEAAFGKGGAEQEVVEVGRFFAEDGGVDSVCHAKRGVGFWIGGIGC
jgi:nucleoside phosphorylase